MNTTNILLAIICVILLVGFALYAYPRYEQWQADRAEAAVAANAADQAQTARTLHAFSAECKGHEDEPDCRTVSPKYWQRTRAENVFGNSARGVIFLGYQKPLFNVHN